MLLDLQYSGDNVDVFLKQFSLVLLGHKVAVTHQGHKNCRVQSRIKFLQSSVKELETPRWGENTSDSVEMVVSQDKNIA